MSKQTTKSDSQQVMRRRGEIVNHIEQRGEKGATAKEIHNSISRDFKVTLKTVQRDLVKLSGKHEKQSKQIEHQIKQSKEKRGLALLWIINPDWLPDHRSSAAPKGLTKSQLKSASVELAIVMLFSHAQHLLHESALQGLRPIYEESLRSLKWKHSGEWQNKVITSSQHYTLQPAKVDPEHLWKVQSALLDGYQLNVRYLSAKSQQLQEYAELHPLGLSYQDSKIYLICHTGDPNQKPRTLALHRIKSINLRESRPVEAPPNFNLADHVMQVQVQPAPIQLKLRISQKLCRTLGEDETPFAEKQCIEQLDDEWFLLTATVPYTQGLKWWILAHGNTIEVLEPLNLRMDVAQILRAACQSYEHPN